MKPPSLFFLPGAGYFHKTALTSSHDMQLYSSQFVTVQKFKWHCRCLPSLNLPSARACRARRERSQERLVEQAVATMGSAQPHGQQTGLHPSGKVTGQCSPRELLVEIPNSCVHVYSTCSARHWFLANETLLSSESFWCDHRHCYSTGLGITFTCCVVRQSFNPVHSNSCTSFGYAHVFPSPLLLVHAPILSVLPGYCSRALATSPSSATL